MRAGMAGNASVAFGLALLFAGVGALGAPLFAMMWDVGTDAEQGRWSDAVLAIVGAWWPAMALAVLVGVAAIALGVLWSVTILRRAGSARPTAITFATLGIARGAELLLTLIALAPSSAGLGAFLIVVAASLDPLASPAPTLSTIGVGTFWVLGTIALLVGMLLSTLVAAGTGAGIGAWMGAVIGPRPADGRDGAASAAGPRHPSQPTSP